MPVEAPTERQLRLTLITCILATGIVFLDSTAVNVALPAIAADLDVGLAAQQWVVEAYLLTLGSLLLVGGSLGDLLGRRRMLTIGVAGFGITSLLCAISPDAHVLIAARALQGAAGALLVPGTLAIIVAAFPEQRRGRAIGSWTAWSGVTSVAGPLVGGVLVDAASWRWIFLIGLVPVAATLVLLRHLPASLDAREPGRIDVVGAVLCSLGLAGPVFALIEQPIEGWSSPMVVVPLLVGLALLAAFLVWESRTPMPMLPLGMFARRNFAAGNASTFAVYGGLGAATFLIPLFLQQVAGYSAFASGLALMPITIVMFVLAKRWGALADRRGPRWFMACGPVVAGVGLLLLIGVDTNAPYASEVLPGVLVFALGLSATVAPLTATVLGDADQHRAGVASGVNNAIARVAGLVAIAVVGLVVSARFSTTLQEQTAGLELGSQGSTAIAEAERRALAAQPTESVAPAAQPAFDAALDEASLDAFHVGIGAAGGLVVLGGLVALVGVRNPRRSVRAEECPGGAICGAPEGVAVTPVPAGHSARAQIRPA